MSSLTFWEAYIKAVTARIRKHTDYLAAGKATSLEQYKEIVGKIAGLKEALDELKQCEKKAGMIDEYD